MYQGHNLTGHMQTTPTLCAAVAALLLTVPPLQEFIDIVETVYRGARKGRGLVVSPKDYSTKYRY
jgi:hypothetical protein